MEAQKKNGDGTIKKCIELFKEGASPEVLTELEKSPEKQEEYQKHYKYYIENFLPALKDEVIKSEELAVPTVFNNEREQSQRPQTIRGKIVGIILDITNRRSDKDHSSSTIQNQNDRRNSQNSSFSVETSKLSNDNGSDSGIESPRKSEENSRSPVSSRKSSMSSILSSAGENNDPQKEDTGNQMQPEQTAEEEPQVSSQCVTLGSREKESMDPNSQTTQMTGSQAKDSMQPEEKRDRKNAITIVQKFPLNKKKGEDTPLEKQSNDRNLHVALAAGCALLAVGCLVAAAIAKSGILCVIGAVFAIEAITTWCLTPSSELTSTNLSRPVDDKELTAL